MDSQELRQLSIKYDFQREMLTKYVKIYFDDLFKEIGTLLGSIVENIEVVYEHHRKRVVILETTHSKYYLKMYDTPMKPHHVSSFNNEKSMLNLLEKNSIIPVPKIALIGANYILVHSIDGEHPRDLSLFSDQLRVVVAEMKRIKRSSGSFIDTEMNTNDKPYETLAEAEKSHNWMSTCKEGFELCHNDLHRENVIVKGHKIVGIIDWELAGFYPISYELNKYNYLKSQYMTSCKVLMSI